MNWWACIYFNLIVKTETANWFLTKSNWKKVDLPTLRIQQKPREKKGRAGVPSVQAWPWELVQANHNIQLVSEIQTSMNFRHSITVLFPNSLDFTQIFVSEIQTFKIKTKPKVRISNNLWILLHTVNLYNYGMVCLRSKIRDLV